jgi:hypothetical protein
MTYRIMFTELTDGRLTIEMEVKPASHAEHEEARDTLLAVLGHVITPYRDMPADDHDEIAEALRAGTLACPTDGGGS